MKNRNQLLYYTNKAMSHKSSKTLNKIGPNERYHFVKVALSISLVHKKTIMKRMHTFVMALILMVLFTLAGCGPVIISSRPQHPMPPWFYPHRVVNVRYIYFPEYSVYYDISLRNYIYWDSGVWIRVTVLPARYNSVNFRRAKQVRVQNYYDDDISRYHPTSKTTIPGRRTVNRN